MFGRLQQHEHNHLSEPFLPNPASNDDIYSETSCSDNLSPSIPIGLKAALSLKNVFEPRVGSCTLNAYQSTFNVCPAVIALIIRRETFHMPIVQP